MSTKNPSSFSNCIVSRTLLLVPENFQLQFSLFVEIFNEKNHHLSFVILNEVKKMDIVLRYIYIMWMKQSFWFRLYSSPHNAKQYFLFVITFLYLIIGEYYQMKYNMCFLCCIRYLLGIRYRISKTLKKYLATLMKILYALCERSVKLQYVFTVSYDL